MRRPILVVLVVLFVAAGCSQSPIVHWHEGEQYFLIPKTVLKGVGDHGRHVVSVSIEAVVKVHRTEVATVVSQLREQSDRPLRPIPRRGRHHLANGVRQRYARVAQVIVSTERAE